jgi:hypothetical protein
MVGKRIVVLHAFIKKTQETPGRELKLARKRMKDLQKGRIETPTCHPPPQGVPRQGANSQWVRGRLRRAGIGVPTGWPNAERPRARF